MIPWLPLHVRAAQFPPTESVLRPRKPSKVFLQSKTQVRIHQRKPKKSNEKCHAKSKNVLLVSMDTNGQCNEQGLIDENNYGHNIANEEPK